MMELGDCEPFPENAGQFAFRRLRQRLAVTAPSKWSVGGGV